MRTLQRVSNAYSLPFQHLRNMRFHTSQPPRGSSLLIMGKKPVLDGLKNHKVKIKRILVAEDLVQAEAIPQIVSLAKKKNIPIIYKKSNSLSRLTASASQDQGIAAEVENQNVLSVEDYLLSEETNCSSKLYLVAFNNVTTPQNVGMAIRSIAAGGWIDGVIVPRIGVCSVGNPLVFKSSAGATLLPRLKLLDCEDLYKALQSFTGSGFQLIGLDQKAKTNIFQFTNSERIPSRAVFVLGGESKGLSAEIRNILNQTISIPIAKDVESLNVAAAATVLSFARSGSRSQRS